MARMLDVPTAHISDCAQIVPADKMPLLALWVRVLHSSAAGALQFENSKVENITIRKMP